MKKIIAEFIGTLTLALFGCGSAVLVGGKAISQLWLFFVAPLIGAGIAGMLYKTKILGSAQNL